MSAKYKFSKKWLSNLLRVKDNENISLSLNDNDTRILLTYIDTLLSKIEELEYMVNDWKERYDELEKDLQENYKPIPYESQIDYSEKDFY